MCAALNRLGFGFGIGLGFGFGFGFGLGFGLGVVTTRTRTLPLTNSGAQVRTTRFGELPLPSLLPRRPGEIAGDDLGTAGDDGEMTGGVQSSGKQRCTANDHAHDHG